MILLGRRKANLNMPLVHISFYPPNPKPHPSLALMWRRNDPVSFRTPASRYSQGLTGETYPKPMEHNPPRYSCCHSHWKYVRLWQNLPLCSSQCTVHSSWWWSSLYDASVYNPSVYHASVYDESNSGGVIGYWRRSHGLSAVRAQRTKSRDRGPEGP